MLCGSSGPKIINFAMNLQRFQKAIPGMQNTKFSYRFSCFFEMRKRAKMRCTEQSEIWCFSGHRARKSSIFAMNLQRFQKVIPGMQNTKFSLGNTWLFEKQNVPKIRSLEQSRIRYFSGPRDQRSSNFAMNLQRFQKVIPGTMRFKKILIFQLWESWNNYSK